MHHVILSLPLSLYFSPLLFLTLSFLKMLLSADDIVIAVGGRPSFPDQVCSYCNSICP